MNKISNISSTEKNQTQSHIQFCQTHIDNLNGIQHECSNDTSSDHSFTANPFPVVQTYAPSYLPTTLNANMLPIMPTYTQNNAPAMVPNTYTITYLPAYNADNQFPHQFYNQF